MAKFYMDFRNEQLGAGVPTGWTQRINRNGSFAKVRSTTVEAGKVFRISASAVGSKVASFNSANGAYDVETLVRFRVNGTEVGRQGIALHRYSGNSEETTAGYALQFQPASSVKSLIISNDQTGATHNFANYNWTAGTQYWARFRTVGNVIQAKVWPHGSTEPAAWNLNSTDNAFSGGPGTYNGVGTFTTNTSGVDFIEYAVATGGDTAEAETPNPTTFPNGYMYRKKITANSSYLHATNGFSGVLNFKGTISELKPVYSGGRLYNQDDLSIIDVVFTDASGVTLPWAIERYNASNGEIVAWLQNPGMTSSANRDIYMYYGKPVSGSSQNVNLLYDGYQFAVWMNGTVDEFNRGGSDWWAARGTVASQNGIHGLSRNLQVGDIYKIYEDKYLLRGPTTLSMTIRVNQIPPVNAIWPLYQITSSSALRLDRLSNGQMTVNFVKYGIADQRINWTPVTGRWYNMQLAVASNHTATLYIDGVSIGTFGNTSAGNAGPANPSIGGPDGTAQTRPDVNVDTVNKVPNTRAAWAVLVEANNYIKSDFWSISGEEVSAVVMNSATHGHYVESITITQSHVTDVLNTVHSVDSLDVSLIQQHVAAVADTIHSVFSDSTSVEETPVLIMSANRHSLTSDTVPLATGFAVLAHNAAHSVLSTNINLSQRQTVGISSSTHSITSSSMQLIESMLVKALNSSHSVRSGEIKLAEDYILVIDESLIRVKSDETRVINWDDMSLYFGIYKPTKGNEGSLDGLTIDTDNIYKPTKSADGELEIVVIDGSGIYKPDKQDNGKYKG